MRYIIFFILLVLCFSCSKNYSIYTECDYTIKALNDWQMIDNFDYYITSRENTSDLVIYKWNRSITPLGVYYGHGVIKANDDYRTVAHEIGHFLEYEHSDNSNSIMYPYDLECATQFIDLRR